MTFDGKTAIVTGGSRGIGRAITAELASRGARVYFTYNRNEDAAHEVEQSCGAVACQCPQNDAEAIDRVVSQVLSDAGSVDILVNNAGITSDQYVLMMSFEDWHKVIDTNLSGAFRWCKAVCRPMMTAQSGAIVNVSSVAGLVGIAGQTNYGASKGGLIALSRSLAAELGPKGIRVNCLVPGYVETDMTARMPRQIKRQSLERVVLKRFGRPEEIARVAAFLASDDASYIIGQTLVVDGGLTGAAG